MTCLPTDKMDGMSHFKIFGRYIWNIIKHVSIASSRRFIPQAAADLRLHDPIRELPRFACHLCSLEWQWTNQSPWQMSSGCSLSLVGFNPSGKKEKHDYDPTVNTKENSENCKELHSSVKKWRRSKKKIETTKRRCNRTCVCVWHICTDVKLLLLFVYIYMWGVTGVPGGSVTNEDTSPGPV